jgi:putative phosphoesterase
MRIAVVSDIHGNDVALAAVIADFERERIARVFVLGDLVGYYYHPERVFELLSDWDCVMVQGNHERLMVESRNSEERADELKAKYGSGLNCALEHLSIKQVAMLAALPATAAVNAEGIRCLLAHGAPTAPDKYLYPDTDEKDLEESSTVEEDFVFVGHSHYPFIYEGREATLVNVGSVGQARGSGGIAQWTVLNTANRTIVQKFTPYDPSSVLSEVAMRDPKIPYLSDVLRR